LDQLAGGRHEAIGIAFLDEPLCLATVVLFA